MFGRSDNKPKVTLESKIDRDDKDKLKLSDMRSYEEEIGVMCLKKCVNDIDEPDLSTSQRICMKRCVHKFATSLDYMNTISSYLERKVNKFQEMPQM